MSTYNDLRILHSEAIERAVDEIIEEVIDSDECVSPETWLAIKASIFALIEEITQDATGGAA